MRQRMKNVFGIDLGTTYTLIAHVDEDGQPVIIPNANNLLVTPSVVFFDDDDEILVGEIANENGKVYPDRVVTLIKRHMGDPDYRFSYKSNIYRPEEIAGFIIRKVVQDAEAYLNEPITDAVITCPAYFGVNEREATQRAGELAGLNVRQIINEPTAAAISYASMGDNTDRTVMVYDLGGGTFDITLLHITPDSIDVICTGGDNNLGGKDWDDCLLNSLAKSFQYKTGIRIDKEKDKDLYHELQLSVEKTKRILGQRRKAPIIINHGGKKVKIEVERSRFDQISGALLAKTVMFTYEMLEESQKKGFSKFDEVILVGGATRMPQISNRIEQEFSIRPKIFDPDGAVAKGAAIFGWKLALNDMLLRRITKKKDMSETSSDAQNDEKSLNEIIDATPENILENATEEISRDTGFTLPAVKRSMIGINNVASKSFGIVVNNVKDEEVIVNLIRKNTTVPAVANKSFATGVENQNRVVIRIMENAVDEKHVPIEDGTEIGTAILNLPSGLPDRSPVEIQFRLTAEGRLQMTAVEKTESRAVDVVVETRSVIHGEEFRKAKERAKKLVVV